MPLEKVCDLLSAEKGLKILLHQQLGAGILGKISFEPPLIEIDAYQAAHPERLRFTLAHEIGHFELGHASFLRNEIFKGLDTELDGLQKIGLRDIRRMEWQANFFASSLLLPYDQFLESFMRQAERLSLVNRGFGVLYLDNQECNINNFIATTDPLIREFNVSRSAIKFRLKNLYLLTDRT